MSLLIHLGSIRYARLAHSRAATASKSTSERDRKECSPLAWTVDTKVTYLLWFVRGVAKMGRYTSGQYEFVF